MKKKKKKPSAPNYEVGVYVKYDRCNAFMTMYQCMSLVEAVNATTKMRNALPVLPEKVSRIGWQKCNNYDPDCGVWKARSLMEPTGMEQMQADELQDAIDSLPVSFKEERDV